jgi:hypothetical protein
MRPPPPKPLDSRRNKTPSLLSSTGSRSRKDMCFICSSVSPYDASSLVTCSACKRKYHRGCHRPAVPPSSSSSVDWRCYRCAPSSKALEESAPVLKRRKLDDGQFAIPNDESNLSNMHLEEIPESPVEIIGAEDPTLSKLAPSNQPVNHAQLPKRKKTRRSRVQKRSRTYEDLIGMALHEAPDQHLEVSDIHQWVFENVPGYDSSDVSWKNGLSIVLTLNDDFVYHSHRSGNSFRDGTWTFRDGVDIKYRRWPGIMSQPSTADSHSRDTHADHSQDKQGAIPSVTAPVYKLEDGIPNPPKIQTTSNTVDSVAGANAISTPLASTIEETLETIDLTMDSEDEPLFVPEPRIPKRKITDDSSLDGSQRATSGNSHDQKQILILRSGQSLLHHSPTRFLTMPRELQ